MFQNIIIQYQYKSSQIQSNPLLFMYNTFVSQTPKIDHHDCDSIFGKPKVLNSTKDALLDELRLHQQIP
jgi:hypothetical protein